MKEGRKEERKEGREEEKISLLFYHTDALSQILLWYSYQIIMRGTKIKISRMRKSKVRKELY